MKTIRLDVSDNVYEKVMFFLRNLPQTDVRVNEEETDMPENNFFKSVKIKTKGFVFNREEANER